MIRAGDFLWRPVAANEGELSPTQDWHSNSILFRAVADLEPGDEHVCVSEVVKWSWPTRVDRRTTTFLQSAPFGHHRASSWDQGDPWWVRPHSCLLLGALGQLTVDQGALLRIKPNRVPDSESCGSGPHCFERSYGALRSSEPDNEVWRS
jgi:hypothetical protein